MILSMKSPPILRNWKKEHRRVTCRTLAVSERALSALHVARAKYANLCYALLESRVVFVNDY